MACALLISMRHTTPSSNPAVVEDCGLKCNRADDVTALYELGVRHALRPYRTIILKEEQDRFHAGSRRAAEILSVYGPQTFQLGGCDGKACVFGRNQPVSDSRRRSKG